MITVQDSLAQLKSASALQGEKITVALNTGERAEKASKNVMKKLGVVTELQGKVNTVQQVQQQEKQNSNELISALQTKFDQLAQTVTVNGQKIATQTNQTEANNEKLVHLNKIRSDIDLIKYTLN